MGMNERTANLQSSAVSHQRPDLRPPQNQRSGDAATAGTDGAGSIDGPWTVQLPAGAHQQKTSTGVRPKC